MHRTSETEFREIGKGVGFRSELSDKLERIVFFKDFSRLEVEGLSTYVECHRISSGSTLIREMQKDARMYFITEGQVDLYKEDANGSQKKLTSVRKGSILGEMSIIDELPSSATAITADETEIVVLTQ